jgi:thiazole synthase
MAMELGMDGVLLNTAIAKSVHPVSMAKAFSLAVTSGRMAYEAGLMSPRDFAVPSTPVLGTPFWHQSATGVSS